MATARRIIARAEAVAQVAIDRVAARVVKGLNRLTSGPRQPHPAVSRAWRGMTAENRDALVDRIALDTLAAHPENNGETVTDAFHAMLPLLNDMGAESDQDECW